LHYWLTDTSNSELKALKNTTLVKNGKIKSLRQICNYICDEDAKISDETFFKLMNLINIDLSTSAIDDFFRDDEIVRGLPIIREKWKYFEEALETGFAKKFISAELQLSNFVFWDRYDTMTANEMSLACINDYSKVLIIGGGPFPITALYYCQLGKCFIDCIDNQQESVLISRQMIKILGLENKINIFLADGKNYDLTGYDVIFVTALALPKQLIFRNILQNASHDCKIIARTVEGLKIIIYEPINDYIKNNFELINKRNGNDKAINSSYLIKKKSEKTFV